MLAGSKVGKMRTWRNWENCMSEKWEPRWWEETSEGKLSRLDVVAGVVKLPPTLMYEGEQPGQCCLYASRHEWIHWVLSADETDDTIQANFSLTDIADQLVDDSDGDRDTQRTALNWATELRRMADEIENRITKRKK